jgi:hypothetical protein
MLDALLGLNLGVDFGSGGSWELVSLATKPRTDSLPAAAAGSTPPDFGVSPPGLSEALPRGLLLRLGSDFLAGGERERRSNLEALFGSGSVWSKRERFAVRRSVSSILGLSAGVN